MALLTKDLDIGAPSVVVFRRADVLPAMRHVNWFDKEVLGPIWKM